jgi:hypothetical protein
VSFLGGSERERAAVAPSPRLSSVSSKLFSIPISSLPALPLGVLADLGSALLPGAAAKLRQTAEAAMDALRAALALAEGAARRAAGAAVALAAAPAPGDPAGVPVFGVLSLPSLAGCFQRVADALAAELVLKRAVVAEVAAVLEARRRRRQRRDDGGDPQPAPPPLAGDALRARFLVCVTAWKLQPEHRADAVAAELAGVAEEMKGW